MVDKLLQISVTHIDPLPISRARPIHVSYDVPREAHLLNPSNPLVDIGNNGFEEMAVRHNDLTQVGKKRVVDGVPPGCTVPWSIGILIHATGDSLPQLGIDRNAPPVRSDLRSEDRVNYYARQILNGIQPPIDPSSDALAGSIHPSSVEDVAAEVTYLRHRDSTPLC